MTKKTLIIYYIIGIVANTLIDYVVTYWGNHQDVAKHLLNCFIYSFILTTIIFVVIRKIAMPPAKK